MPFIQSFNLLKMNVEEIREFCITLKGTTESFPFDEVTLVFKVGNKMYALLSLDEPLSINLKCDPEIAIELRERYPSVVPGYHMNKVHWNSIFIDGTIPNSIIKEWIMNSYDLIFKSLPKFKQVELTNH
jgi:predicted DNA-binding protein (MmcQ/YjbR family)